MDSNELLKNHRRDTRIVSLAGSSFLLGAVLAATITGDTDTTLNCLAVLCAYILIHDIR